MRAVAKWLAGGVLAAAQPLRSRFFSCEYQRLNIRRRMCAVAERLSRAQSAPAPRIFLARFQIDFVWCFLGDNGFTHVRHSSRVSKSRARRASTNVAIGQVTFKSVPGSNIHTEVGEVRG